MYRTALEEDDIIPQLPTHHLPASDMRSVKPSKRKQQTGPHHIPSLAVLAVIPLQSESEKPQLKKAKKTHDELQAYINGYKPSERLPFGCRVCKFQGSSLEVIGSLQIRSNESSSLSHAPS